MIFLEERWTKLTLFFFVKWRNFCPLLKSGKWVSPIFCFKNGNLLDLKNAFWPKKLGFCPLLKTKVGAKSRCAATFFRFLSTFPLLILIKREKKNSIYYINRQIKVGIWPQAIFQQMKGEYLMAIGRHCYKHHFDTDILSERLLM